MIKIAGFEEDFDQVYKKEKRPIIAYGCGNGFFSRRDRLPKIDMICDRAATSIGSIDGIKVYPPSEILEFDCSVYIIVTVMKHEAFQEICTDLNNLGIDAKVFHLYNNVAFTYKLWDIPNTYVVDSNDMLKINLVCEEQYWILKKFADRMESELKKIDNVSVTVSSKADKSASINHHIQFATFPVVGNDTLMISHVDNIRTVQILKHQLENSLLGICMSKDTMNKLVSLGIKRDKLCYINPAHDGVIKARKYRIGMTNRCYPYDMRKRDNAILDILQGVNPQMFQFCIMGQRWEDIVDHMRNMGFEVEYYPEFDYDKYIALIPELDYFLYYGFDEGTMGYLDAISAGVGTIVTPQGFHLDNCFPIDYPCRTIEQFRNAFLDLQRKKEEKIKSVETWTWKNYVMKHMEVWWYLLGKKPLTELFCNKLLYEDGIHSMILEDIRI